MTAFARPCARIDREAQVVMHATCEDVLPQRQELWPRFERLVGLRGRKMAVADLVAGTYSTCTPVRSGDDPEQLGLNLGSLPPGSPWRRSVLFVLDDVLHLLTARVARRLVA